MAAVVNSSVDQAERERLVTGHIGLARSLARRFANRGEPLADLEQCALLALVKAARRYDPSMGAAFSTFATPTVLGELKRYFRDHSWGVRVPRATKERYLALQAANEELEQQRGRPATIADLSRHLAISEEEILEAMEAGHGYRPGSIDAPQGGSELSVVDVLARDEQPIDGLIDREVLRLALGALPHRDQLIVKHYFFDGWTQSRIADEIGTSQMQVSRLLRRSIHLLRHSLVPPG